MGSRRWASKDKDRGSKHAHLPPGGSATGQPHSRWGRGGLASEIEMPDGETGAREGEIQR